MRPFAAWVGLLALECVAAAALTGAEPLPAVRVDLWGDPLPRGAISRLGTVRPPRPGEVERRARFSCDDFGTFSPSGKLFASRFQLWDVPTGRVLNEFAPPARFLFGPGGTPFVVSYGDDRLSARPVAPVPPGWEIVTEAPAISPASGHVIIRYWLHDDEARKLITALRNIWTGLDEHRLENAGVAARAPEPGRVGVSADGTRLAVVTHAAQIELHLRGKGKQNTTPVPLAGLSPDNQLTTTLSPDGKHVVAVPEKRRGRIHVLSTAGLGPGAALRDMLPLGYDHSNVGFAFLREPPQLAVLRGGEDGVHSPVLKVWNVETEGMTAQRHIKQASDLRDAALWLAARGLRGNVPEGFVPLDAANRARPALQCRLSMPHLNATAAISKSGELVACADDISISIWETATRKCVQRWQPPGGIVQRMFFSPDDRLLLVQNDDATALILASIEPSGDLRARAAAELWDDLAGFDARAARRSMLELARRGDEALPFLDRPFPRRHEPDEIRGWISDLDGREKVVRDAAQNRLYALGPVGLPYLQAAIRGDPSQDQIVRIRAILEHPAETVVDPEILRGVRAIQLAALLRSEPAIDWLRRISTDNYDTRLVSRAAETVKRLRPTETTPKG